MSKKLGDLSVTYLLRKQVCMKKST